MTRFKTIPQEVLPVDGEAPVEALAIPTGCKITVLCGQIHSAGEAEILPNLRVSMGGAQYGSPVLQRVRSGE